MLCREQGEEVPAEGEVLHAKSGGSDEPNRLIQLIGTDGFYGRANGRPHWTSRKNAKRFANLAIAKEVVRLLHNRGIPVKLVVVISSETGRVDKHKAYSTQEQARLFMDFRKMAMGIGHRLGQRFGHSADLVDRAVSYLGILICEKWDEYDKTRAARSTWVYWSLYWYLLTIARREFNRRETSLWDANTNGEGFHTRLNRLDQLRSEMGDDASFIVDLVREDLDRMVRDFKLPLHFRLLEEYLIQECDWTWERVQKARAELQEVFT